MTDAKSNQCPFCKQDECNCRSVEHVWEKRNSTCGCCADYNNFDCTLTSECHKNIVIAGESTIAELEKELVDMCEAVHEEQECHIDGRVVCRWCDGIVFIIDEIEGHQLEYKFVHADECPVSKATTILERLKGGPDIEAGHQGGE